MCYNFICNVTFECLIAVLFKLVFNAKRGQYCIVLLYLRVDAQLTENRSTIRRTRQKTATRNADKTIRRYIIRLVLIKYQYLNFNGTVVEINQNNNF